MQCNEQETQCMIHGVFTVNSTSNSKDLWTSTGRDDVRYGKRAVELEGMKSTEMPNISRKLVEQ